MEMKNKVLFVCLNLCFVTHIQCMPSNTSFTECSTNICENGGSCFQDVQNNGRTFCRCVGDYYGDKCENEAEPIYKNVLYGMIMLVALLIIATVYFSCQFYVRKSDLDDAKREKMEIEQHYQKQLNARHKTNNKNLSRQSSIRSDISSISPHFYEVTDEGKLRKTNIEKDEKDHLQLEYIRSNSIRKSKDVESDLEAEEQVTTDFTEDLKAFKPEKNNHGLLDVQQSKERPKSWAGSDEFVNKQLTRSLSSKSDTKSIDSTNSKTSAVSQRGLTPELVRKHHARSLQDLRELAMNDATAPNPTRKDQYVLNMHTGQITKARSRDTIIQKAINQNKNQGIWAHSQQRQRDR